MNPRHNGLNEKDRSKEEDPNGKGKETGDDNLFNVWATWVKGGFHPEEEGEEDAEDERIVVYSKGKKTVRRTQEEYKRRSIRMKTSKRLLFAFLRGKTKFYDWVFRFSKDSAV
ncbi:hypothetical protein RUM43_000495, partial [Polyplax serrata]